MAWYRLGRALVPALRDKARIHGENDVGALLCAEAANEIELLRYALVQYGDKSRMSWAPAHLQPVIDAAFQAQKQERD